jgi:hypothetical protein
VKSEYIISKELCINIYSIICDKLVVYLIGISETSYVICDKLTIKTFLRIGVMIHYCANSTLVKKRSIESVEYFGSTVIP